MRQFLDSGQATCIKDDVLRCGSQTIFRDGLICSTRNLRIDHLRNWPDNCSIVVLFVGDHSMILEDEGERAPLDKESNNCNYRPLSVGFFNKSACRSLSFLSTAIDRQPPPLTLVPAFSSNLHALRLSFLDSGACIPDRDLLVAPLGHQNLFQVHSSQVGRWTAPPRLTSVSSQTTSDKPSPVRLGSNFDVESILTFCFIGLSSLVELHSVKFVEFYWLLAQLKFWLFLLCLARFAFEFLRC